MASCAAAKQSPTAYAGRVLQGLRPLAMTCNSLRLSAYAPPFSEMMYVSVPPAAK
jgi:hypothetical protein